MKPIEFAEQNVVMGKNQPEYMPLPAWKGNPDSEVISCWRMDWRERLRVLITGRVYVTQLTFGAPLQPQRVGVSLWDTPLWLATLVRIGLTKRKPDGKWFVPFHMPPYYKNEGLRGWLYRCRFQGAFYVFRNRPGLITRMPGRMLPRRWGFGVFGFEFGDRG